MEMIKDEPLRGITFYIMATIIFTVADTIAKTLTCCLPAVQITWMRYIVFTGFALMMTWRRSGPAFHVHSPRLQLARGLCLAASSILFILGIRDIGLAEAATIGFLGPIMVTVLSIPLLGEVVGLRRWAAVAAGMLGVLIVLRPGTGTFQPEGLYRVGSAMFWAIGLILTRKMAGTDRAETTMFWSALTGLIVLSAAIPFSIVMPSPRELWLALAQSVLSSAGQWLVIQSLRYTPASILAAFSYTQLLWSTIAGFLVFSVLPDRWTWLGAAIIIASGVYTAHRERVRALDGSSDATPEDCDGRKGKDDTGAVRQ
ncbi:MAG: DMT family transporter [Acetobacteraceae bacterium]|nr:DMT family transporter [Acetobacteraceae bacterium]